MICATPCIVSFNKRFKKHERINLLWSNCQQATRGAFGRACEALVFGPKCAAFFMWQICNKKRKTTKSKNMFDLNVTPAEELLSDIQVRFDGKLFQFGSLPLPWQKNKQWGSILELLHTFSKSTRESTTSDPFFICSDIWPCVHRPGSMWGVTAAIVFSGLAWTQRLNKGN